MRIVPLLLLCSLTGCASVASTPREPVPARQEPAVAEPDFAAAWLALEVSEEVLALVQTELNEVAHGMEELALPSVRARTWFDPIVRVVDVVGFSAPHASAIPPRFDVTQRDAILGEPRSLARDELRLLMELFAPLDRVEDAHLSARRGAFLDPERLRFEAKVGLAVRGRELGGAVVAARGALTIVMERREPGERRRTRTRWAITELRVESLHTLRREGGPLFDEVLGELLPPALAGEAIRSRHEELVEEYLADSRGFKRPFDAFDVVSHDRHPALAVADVDGDHRDELYVMGRHGPNLLLRRGKDGRWTDIAPELGLDLSDHCSAALFADFDNDGDQDVFVGRTMARSLLLMQEGGRFVDRSDRVAGPLPMLVSAVSAADVDRDGRLDLFVATYAAKLGKDYDPTLAPSAEEAESQRVDWHPIYNDAGPANVLLRNLGAGRFADQAAERGLRTYRQTFQGTFADVDADGDPDLYLANDYAPNNLFINRGDGTFEDATERTGTADVGFGMGASFGDFDGDADLDLYVSNMYSKAGERVIAALPGLDPRFAPMARGNSLFRNEGQDFQRVSGRKPPALAVEATGWSWGGLFTDFDLDGWPDIAVLNGYFSPPPRYARPVDI